MSSAYPRVTQVCSESAIQPDPHASRRRADFRDQVTVVPSGPDVPPGRVPTEKTDGEGSASCGSPLHGARTRSAAPRLLVMPYPPFSLYLGRAAPGPADDTASRRRQRCHRIGIGLCVIPPCVPGGHCAETQCGSRLVSISSTAAAHAPRPISAAIAPYRDIGSVAAHARAPARAWASAEGDDGPWWRSRSRGNVGVDRR